MEGESKSESNTMSGSLALPEDCIAAVISFTSPRDACRLACVSSTFRSAAESDSVWDRFLPCEYLTAISASSSTASSKKELYLHACHNPVPIHEGKLSFWLDKPSGKKCYMISHKVEWGYTFPYFGWISLPYRRFPEVSEIGGEISTSLLSPRATYVAYLVFKPSEEPYGFEQPYGFEHNLVEVSVGLGGGERRKRTVDLDIWKRRDIFSGYPICFLSGQVYGSAVDQGSFPEKRVDGWYESELGEYFYEGDEDSALSMTIMVTKRGNWKEGLVFQGIEIRPKKEYIYSRSFL